MTEDLQKQITELTNRNNALETQSKQNATNFDGLVAQLDAHKGLLNESLSQGLTLRANIIMAQKEMQKLNTALADANKKLDEANKRIAELEAQPTQAAA